MATPDTYADVNVCPLQFPNLSSCIDIVHLGRYFHRSTRVYVNRQHHHRQHGALQYNMHRCILQLLA